MARTQLKLDYYGGTSGTYAGLDRFGRVVDQRWVDHSGTPTDVDRYGYAYDQNSNRTERTNDGPSASGLDELYTYDGLSRLTSSERGDLSGGSISNLARAEDWSLSAVGGSQFVGPATCCGRNVGWKSSKDTADGRAVRLPA